MKNKELSKSDLAKSYLEDVLVAGLSIRVCHLFLDHDESLLVKILNQDMITRFYLEIISGFQTVKHDVFLVLIFELTGVLATQTNDA